MDVRPVPLEFFRPEVRGSCHDWYQVDLEEYGGNGWCGCEDFEKKRYPIFVENFGPGDASRCKHIRAARIRVSKWLQEMIPTPGIDPIVYLDAVIKERRRVIREIQKAARAKAAIASDLAFESWADAQVQRARKGLEERKSRVRGLRRYAPG